MAYCTPSLARGTRARPLSSTLPLHLQAPGSASGTPAVAGIEAYYDDPDWCVIAPCQSGGMLYTLTRPSQGWESTKQIAAHTGIVSAVSVAVTHRAPYSDYCINKPTDIVAACIASARLYSIEWPFGEPVGRRKNSWQGPKSMRIQHPGEVTGNPVLLSKQKAETDSWYLDVLAPCAEGGIFHFIRTPKSPDECGRISFPPGLPMVSSLACAWLIRDYHGDVLRAHVQCGGRLYHIKTTEGASPWTGSELHPIKGPGPSRIG